MSTTPFQAPSLEVLSGLLPAYKFEAFVAQGGMGAVYKARQRSLDRDVAIKILPRELGQDPAFHRSFETEARAMARLNHPNLIGVYDSGDLDGMLYIAMEFVNGKSLYYSAYNLAVDPAQAATIVKGICDGLAHAHENGVIHRDIKPANILLTAKREPKIGDFGLARPSGAEGPGLVMGTPGYTAPEVINHPEHADRRSDIYAVGVILYELLTGGNQEPNCPPPSTVKGCDRELDTIWQNATHPNPAFRYAEAGLMSKALEDWLAKPGASSQRKLVVSATNPTAPRTLAVSPARPAPASASTPPSVAVPPTPAPPQPVAASKAPSPRTLAVPAAKPAAGHATPPPAAAAPPEATSRNPLTAPGARAPRASAGLAVKAASAVGNPPPAAAPQVVLRSGGGNWSLVRNLSIIAVLLLAIAFAWKTFQRDKAGREESRRIAVERDAERRAKAAAGDRDVLATPAAAPAPATPAPVPAVPEPPKPETALEALARLKTALAAGKRDEMPAGTVRHGESDFLRVPTPMTWQEASAFADAHGGHLPLPAAEEDITWLSSKVPAGDEDATSLWIGAGRAGRSAWTLADGSPWKLKTPAGTGLFLAVDDLGLIRVRKAGDRHPFLIQWQRDGSNPADLATVLKRTRESLDLPVPLFPPGTLAYEARNCLVLLREVNAAKAAAFAEIAGGHLMVPASRDEAGWLSEHLAPLSADKGLWLGGKRVGSEWKWATGEAWTFAGWSDGFPTGDDDGMVIVPGKGWQNANAAEPAAGFVIEWSNDAASAPGTSGKGAGQVEPATGDPVRKPGAK